MDLSKFEQYNLNNHEGLGNLEGLGSILYFFTDLFTPKTFYSYSLE